MPLPTPKQGEDRDDFIDRRRRQEVVLLQSAVAGVPIVTMFTGSMPPYETRVGSDNPRHMHRQYSTEDEATQGHKDIVHQLAWPLDPRNQWAFITSSAVVLGEMPLE